MTFTQFVNFIATGIFFTCLITYIGFLFVDEAIFTLNKKIDYIINSNKLNKEKTGLDVEYVSTITNQNYFTNVRKSNLSGIRNNS